MTKNVLFVGSHPDDIELGCLGTILHYTKKEKANVHCMIASDGEGGNSNVNKFDRVKEAIRCLVAAGISKKNIHFLHLPDRQLEMHSIRIIDEVENICKNKSISWLFIQTEQDIHQDHRAVFKAAMSAGRNVGNILIYESNSSTTSRFSPNYFFDVAPYIKQKTKLLRYHHKSQIDRHYMKVDSVAGLARYRGAQSRQMPYAEAFEVFRISKSNSGSKNDGLDPDG